MHSSQDGLLSFGESVSKAIESSSEDGRFPKEKKIEAKMSLQGAREIVSNGIKALKVLKVYLKI